MKRFAPALVLFVAPSTLVAQATLNVPAEFATIQGAIDAAANGDTVLVAAGTYHEQLDLLGKAITVRGSAGAAQTIVDSQGAANWPDFPFGPVVRMIQGEGRDTVLEGLTITGGQTTAIGSAGYNGIWCSALSPTIRGCIVTGNSGGLGGGILGDPLIVDSTISDNDSLPYGEGGGIWGAPTIVDSRITGNHSGGAGGGLYVTGPCTIEGSVIDSNESGNGFDGYSGGGVFGPATLVRTQITRNAANHYFSGGPPDEIGTGVDGAVALSFCTVADNTIANGVQPGEPSGGVRNVGTIENSIVWNNEGNEVAVGSRPTVRYTIVGGGFPGTGNLADDPEFRDAPAGDYFLELGSPAIDAGDPAAPFDPDGTFADMGALVFPQFAASLALRNGNRVNPLCYQSRSDPVVGELWSATVDADAHGFTPSGVALVGYAQPLAPLALPFGELLVDPGSLLLFTTVGIPIGGQAHFPIPIPENYALGGLTVYTQAVVIGTGTGLCNALDLTVGL